MDLDSEFREAVGDALSPNLVVDLVAGRVSEYRPGSATSVVISPPLDPIEAEHRIDAVAVLTPYLLLLLFIPYYVVFAPLGGSGGPSTMYAAILMVLYLVLWLRPSFGLDRSTQPVRVVAVLFVCAIVGSYVSANRHTLPTLEQNGADRGLISVFGWLAILLFAADGIDRSDRFKTLIRRIVLGVTVMALIGLVQFFAHFDVTKYISIPGFSSMVAYGEVGRDGLLRPASTAAHPLEFAAVLAMILPLAIHRARFAPAGRLGRRWLQVVLIGAALPLTVSRSAVLGLIVIATVLLPTWPKFDRRVAYVAILLFVAVAAVAVHGLLGTFVSLFSNQGAAQASNQSRANAFSSAGPLVGQHPWFGRGFGTFLPQTYFFTDDQYLNSIIVTGIFGLLALVALFVTGWLMARSARRLTIDAETRDMAQCLAASIAVAAVSFVTFDALSFTISAGLTFLLLGCVGALWRITRTNIFV